MKYIVPALVLVSVLIIGSLKLGSSPKSSINPATQFFCLSPMGYETVRAADPGVEVNEKYIQISRAEGVFLVPLSICVQVIPNQR